MHTDESAAEEFTSRRPDLCPHRRRHRRTPREDSRSSRPAEPQPNPASSPISASSRQSSPHAQRLKTPRTPTTSSIPHEMILLDLYRALWALDSLTGQTTPDDILNLIFSTFCIGK